MTEDELSRTRAWQVPGVLLLVAFAPFLRAESIAAPEAVGLSSGRLQRLDDVIDAYVDEGKLAGAVTLVARDGRIVHLRAAGFQDVESGQAMREDSIFRIFSMTKPITSVALLMLYERGYFQLDDPLEKFIPAFSNVMVFDGLGESGQIKVVAPLRKITVRDILTHTGGVSYGRSEHAVDQAYRAAGIVEGSGSVRSIVGKVARMPLRTQPGTFWYYSFSHDIQAFLVELFSGMPFDRYLDERIFQPLGMRDTGFYLPESKRHRLTSVYSPPGGLDGQLPFTLELTPGLERIESARDDRYREHEVLPSGGTGLLSTAQDYYRFAQMLVNDGEFDGARLLGNL